MALPGPGNKNSGAVVSNAVTLKPVEVPQALQDGEKFIKWDEVSEQTFSTSRESFLGGDISPVVV